MMLRLFSHSEDILRSADTTFERFIISEIDPDTRLTGIICSFAAGRAGILVHLMKEAEQKEKKVLFLDLKDPYFTSNSLQEAIREFYRTGGEVLFADNIQRYLNAGKELVHASTEFPDLRIFYSGSFYPDDDYWLKLGNISSLHDLPGLSYREFLEYRYKLTFPKIEFDELLELNRNPGASVLNRIRPLEHFRDYLDKGYYEIPYSSAGDFQGKLHILIDGLIDSDLSAAYNLDNLSTIKIKRMMMKLANKGLYRPNIERIAREIGTTRDSLLKFLKYAGKAGLIRMYYKESRKISGKPQMIILDNPTLMSVLNPDRVDREQLWENFLFNQLSCHHDISMPGEDRIIIDERYSFQMSWKTNKASRNSPPPDYIIYPDIEHQTGSHIPLWMIGFLY